MKKYYVLLILALTSVFGIQIGYSQTTFTVTSTAKDGPGSINEAIGFANSTFGADIIEFTPGLQIDATHLFYIPGGLADYMLNITESVTIDGKGGALIGSQRWLNANGDWNSLNDCPGNVPNGITRASMPNFMQVGIIDEDNAAITVTVKNLSIEQFNSIAKVRENATLEFENFNADKIWSTLFCNSRGLLSADAGASISIKNSQFINTVNWGVPGTTSEISSSNAGDLTIENTLFYNNNGGEQFAISWDGASGSEVNIVSSRFMLSGGIFLSGSISVSNFVNSIWVNKDTENPESGDRIINSASGDMNITASSLMWNNNYCDGVCQSELSESLIERRGAGKINFKESAIGLNNTSGLDTLLNTLGNTGTGAGFSADTETWIQPTTNQDVAALRAITFQPVLRSNGTAFNSPVVPSTLYFDAEMVTPAFPGELIDIIPAASVLTNPINSTPITMDVFGNARNDANGLRDIGAFQLGLASALSLGTITDGSVGLSWTEPLHHDGIAILNYRITYSEVGGFGDFVDVPSTNLTTTITGLTNGVEYEFAVQAIYGAMLPGDLGPPSNTVSAIPFGTMTAPTLTATPGNTEVALSWNLPDLGGRTFQQYTILWYENVSGAFVGAHTIADPNETTYTVTGLTNGTIYDFRITARASEDTSPTGTASATPISHPKTYTVTSTSVGPNTTSGTFLWAVDQANTNAGADIIQFTAGLQVNASVNPTGSNPFMAEITESVTIDGNGGALNGNQFWVNQSGIINPLTACPGNVSGTTQTSFMPGFLKVGTPGADNSAIEVTAKNLTIKQFNSIATVSDNATLKFDNFEATETWSTYGCVSEPAILARAGASLEIYNSRIQDAVMWGISGGSAAIFSAPNAGDLTIEDSVLLNNNLDEQPLINWNGASGSKVNVVSSRLIRSGGIISDGASVSNIVNSTWVTNKFTVPGLGDRFENISSQPMNITASSFVWNTWECDGLCQNFLAFNNLFEIKGAGNINFSETAVGFNFPASGGATALLNTLGINGGAGVFTADAYTWIQPTTQQNAAALKTVTNQPALLTTTPAFNSPVTPLGTLYDLELAAPAFPGELIDAIPSGTPLINPIDGLPITLDVAGNSREDANGARDIGAIQLGLAPNLTVDGIGDGSVDLSWNEPLHHNGLSIISYEIEYSETGNPGSTTIPINPPVLSQTVSGLTNGTEYNFEVRAVYTGSENGPYSNIVTARPLVPIVAGADAVDRYPSQSVKVSVATLLSNDVNPATGTNAGLSITAVNNPGGSPATVTLSGDTVFYSPNGHLTADTFEYTVVNSLGPTATGTVTVSLIVDNEPSQNVISFKVLAGGSAETVFGGIPGRTYRIQTSENLINWTDVDTVVADGVGRVMFTDPPPLVPSRFYRTVSP